MPNRKFRLSTALTAGVGSVSLLLTGEAHSLMAVPSLLIPLGYVRSYLGRPNITQKAVAAFVFLDLALFFLDLVFVSEDTLLAVVHLTLFFQALKSFDLNTHEDHTQVHFMGLLQIILVSELTLSVWFALVLALFMVILVVSLMDGYLHSDPGTERVAFTGAAAKVSGWTLLTLVLLFILVPRTAWTGFWGKSHLKRIATTGFSDEMDFGSYGDVKTDDTVVMRVELEGPAPGELYWRGSTLDRFDGRAWTRSNTGERLLFSRDKQFVLGGQTRESLVKQTIYLEPINTRVLFGLPTSVAMEAEFMYIGLDDHRVMKLKREPRGRVRYTLWSDPNMAVDIRKPRPSDLQLPQTVGRIPDLAREVVSGIEDPQLKAMTIGKYLQGNMAYALETRRTPRGISPIEDFLFNTRQGYCEHFSTAMTLMLRSVNIPARVVTGFLGGDVNPLGNYVLVRQSDAHAWVEAYIGGRWMRFDPTPSAPPSLRSATAIYLDAVRMAWFKYVISYSSLEQRRAVRTLESGLSWISRPHLPDMTRLFSGLSRKGLTIIGFMAAALFLGWKLLLLFHRQNRSPQRSALQSYERILKRLHRAGFSKSLCETPKQFAERVARAGGPVDAIEASEIYYRIRYGGDAGLLHELDRIATRIEQQLATMRKPAPPNQEALG